MARPKQASILSNPELERKRAVFVFVQIIGVQGYGFIFTIVGKDQAGFHEKLQCAFCYKEIAMAIVES